MQWCRKKLKSLFPKGHRQLCYVDDWDPELNEIRQVRVLEDAEDAWSGEEYFKHTDNDGLARFVRPDRQRREKYNIRKLNALEAYQFMESDDEEEGGEEETNVKDSSMDVEKSLQEPGEKRFQVSGLRQTLRTFLDPFLQSVSTGIALRRSSSIFLLDKLNE